MSGSNNQVIFTDGACENNGKPEALESTLDWKIP